MAALSECNHSFCKSCTKSWLIRNKSCPLDRQTISHVSVYNSIKKTFETSSVTEFLIKEILENSEDTVKTYKETLMGILCKQIQFLTDLNAFLDNIEHIQNKYPCHVCECYYFGISLNN